jgi:hypothetical protein
VNFIAATFRIKVAENTSGTPVVDVGRISNDATAADNAEAFFDGTGYAGTNNVIPTVTTATSVTTVNGLANNVITAASIAADAITAAKIADGAIDAATFAAGAINAAAIADGAIDAATFAASAITSTVLADNAITAGKINAGAITAAKFGASAIDATALASDAVTEIATAVNAEVVDALATDTYAEPGQGSPAATLSLAAKIGYIYKAWRNRSTQTASEYALYGDDGVTKDQEAAVSDDGTTFVRSEIQTGA